MDRIKVNNIRKNYKNFCLKDISFDLKSGYITGFIGPNGSGKTTTIKSILSFIKIDGGFVKYNDKDIKDYSYLKDIGIVTDSSYLPKDWTIMDVNSAMKIGYKNWNSKKFFDLIDKYQIKNTLKVEELSKGMNTKLMLAIALSHDAKTLILDEPTSGLDPAAREEFRDIIQDYMQLDSSNTVLFSTHITTDLEQIADYILFIINGKMVFYGNKDDLLEEFRIIKIYDDNLLDIKKSDLIGLKRYETRSEALVRKENINDNINLVIEKPTIDQIMTFFTREKNNE